LGPTRPKPIPSCALAPCARDFCIPGCFGLRAYETQTNSILRARTVCSRLLYTRMFWSEGPARPKPIPSCALAPCAREIYGCWVFFKFLYPFFPKDLFESFCVFGGILGQCALCTCADLDFNGLSGCRVSYFFLADVWQIAALGLSFRVADVVAGLWFFVGKGADFRHGFVGKNTKIWLCCVRSVSCFCLFSRVCG